VSASPGKQLIERGKPLESISLIVRGKVHVTHEVLGELGPGEMVGSALLLSGARAETDAVTTEVTRTIRWNSATLERISTRIPTPEICSNGISHVTLPARWDAWAATSPGTGSQPIGGSALKMNEAFVRSDSRALQAGDHRFDPGHVHHSFNHLHRCRLAAFSHSRRFFD
jgi:hypothetical protein